MSISVQCPGCEKKLKVKDELAGKRVKCPNCAQVVVVPSVRSASLQSTAPNPSPSKSPLRRGSEATASSATQSRPARWPWYAGGGAAFLCVLAAWFKKATRRVTIIARRAGRSLARIPRVNGGYPSGKDSLLKGVM